MNENFYSPQVIPDNEEISFVVEDFLTIKIRRSGYFYSIEVTKNDESCPIKEDFVLGKDYRIKLKPAFPDLPLVVMPETVLNILPGRKDKLFIQYPLPWKIVAIHEKKEEDLMILPVFPLSRTWFGDPFNGESAYSFPCNLSNKPMEARPFSCLTAFTIRNETEKIMKFQRFCLRTAYLTLYSNGRDYVSNDVFFRIKDADQNSLASYSPKPPEEFKNLISVQKAQLTVSRSIIKKSFYLLKSLSEM